ncbi:hypothetical protein Syun_010196 [Stephania yunnanensis]|uniref:Uncharacterized protein n=1 Tax=Stephania yunnanensis TaxID=152371 RepID=A0AAP0KG32_9MAGN
MDLFMVGFGVVANLVEYLVGPLGLGLKDSNGYVRMVATIGAFKLYHISRTRLLQIVYLALQEIWSLEASSSEEASKEREALLSKPQIYYLLNLWARLYFGFRIPFVGCPQYSFTWSPRGAGQIR